MEDTATILSVDDNAELRELVGAILGGAGFRVLSVANAEAALRILERSEPIDLLLTDIVMPGLNGMALARIARRLRPGLRVLYTSGYWPYLVNEPDHRDIVRKPYVPSQLVGQVRGALDDLDPLDLGATEPTQLAS